MASQPGTLESKTYPAFAGSAPYSQNFFMNGAAGLASLFRNAPGAPRIGRSSRDSPLRSRTGIFGTAQQSSPPFAGRTRTNARNARLLITIASSVLHDNLTGVSDCCGPWLVPSGLHLFVLAHRFPHRISTTPSNSKKIFTVKRNSSPHSRSYFWSTNWQNSEAQRFAR